jgi:hypothetical protein
MISKLFKGIPFTGTYRKECPDGVTYKDEGKLPLTPPTICLEYKFDSFTLGVEMSNSTTENAVSKIWAATKPEKNVLDNKIDELYLETLSRLEKARHDALKNPAVAERCPGLQSMKIPKCAHFARLLTMQAQHCPEETVSKLEAELNEAYGISCVEKLPELRHIYLKNGAVVQLSDVAGTDYITMVLCVNFENHEELKDLLMKALKEQNPVMDMSNPHMCKCAWHVNMHGQGYYVLESMLKEDIAMLRNK